MFNLLVSISPDAWETGDRMSIQADRFLESSGDQAKNILNATSPGSWTCLEGIATLLVYEDRADGPGAEVVRVGKLRDIRRNGGYMEFRFSEEGRISRSKVVELRNRLQLGKLELTRTHWAVKDDYVPQELLAHMVPTARKYDVALSYAGEDRAYVSEVAKALRLAEVDVFYDEFEEATLWGKDMYEHLSAVYRKNAAYCVMFVSKHYEAKHYPRLERRAAFARALIENNPYLLPVRFDDTEVEGLNPSIHYKDARVYSAQQIADFVLNQLRRGPA